MLKNRGAIQLLFSVGLLVGLAVFPAQADLGLQGILASEGATAVGKAVKAAVEAVYSSTDDPAEIESQIVAILNEAAATGDEGVIRYTIVAVMMAGGSDHLDLSKSAIDSSNAFNNFPEITAFTVSAAESMLSTSSTGESGGAGDESGGGEKGVGGSEEEGGGAMAEGELGGGDDPNPLGDGGDADIVDNDVPGTRI